MGTRSYIGMERGDGRVSYIYCHWDGYPYHNGAVLLEHYSSPERMERLLALGDISSLASRLDPTQTSLHGFGHDESEDGVVVAYHRERGEKWDDVKPKEAESVATIPTNQGAEYIYVYRPTTGDWAYGSNDWTGVTFHIGRMIGEPTWVWRPLTPEACKEAE